MFNPNEHRSKCEAYLSHYLDSKVEFLRAEMLIKSTRQAPWRLDVRVDGTARSFVLQLDPRRLENEYKVLKAMERIPIPTPRVYGLDLQGEAFGESCFFSDFIEGESLLQPMLEGEEWAAKLYLDAVCALQSVTEDDLGEIANSLRRETAVDVLENARDYFEGISTPMADAAYRTLKQNMPEFPALCFSNGDLWLDNFLVEDKKLVGVIDFTGAGFSDPLFEFLLSFFVEPGLQRRGIEARYCQRLGYDPEILDWYHGLEYYDTLHWVLKTGEDFVHHSAQSLEANLQDWINHWEILGPVKNT